MKEPKISKVKHSLESNINNIKEKDKILWYIIVTAIVVSIFGTIYICYKNYKEKNDFDY